MLLSECGQSFNCTRCEGEGVYFMPYKDGDVLYFQTQFADMFNENQEEPVSGWGEMIVPYLCDAETGAVIATGQNVIGGGMVGWDGECSYQILRVNTSQIPVDCWNIQIRAFDCDGNETCCLETQHFAKIQDCDAPTLVLESEHFDKDCEGNFYGEPVENVGGAFRYKNTIRIKGQVMCVGGSLSKSLYEERQTSITTTDTYQIIPYGLVPPYLEKYLRKIVLAGDNIKMTDDYGKVYRFSAANITPSIERTTFRAFRISSIEIQDSKTCDSSDEVGGGCF